MTEPARLSPEAIHRYHNDAPFHAVCTAVARRLVELFGPDHNATAAAIELVHAIQSATHTTRDLTGYRVIESPLVPPGVVYLGPPIPVELPL